MASAEATAAGMEEARAAAATAGVAKAAGRVVVVREVGAMAAVTAAVVTVAAEMEEGMEAAERVEVARVAVTVVVMAAAATEVVTAERRSPHPRSTALHVGWNLVHTSNLPPNHHWPQHGVLSQDHTAHRNTVFRAVALDPGRCLRWDT